MLKYKADIISVIYMLIITSVFVVHWNWGGFNWFLYSITLIMTPVIFVMVHNHNHLAMWKSRFMNRLTDLWQVAFYGYPVFVWVPTHNLNHHKYANKVGDYTITYRFGNHNNILTFLAYPFISSFYQSEPIKAYLRKQRTKNPGRFYYCIFQYIFLLSYLGVMFYLDYEKAFLLVLIPQVFCLAFVLMINYMQHVHADEKSEYNHSRNFLGIENKFMLNNGLHTAHHEKMSCHWSELMEVHKQIEPKINPALIEKSLIWYMIRVYLLSLFVPKFRSRQIEAA